MYKLLILVIFPFFAFSDEASSPSLVTSESSNTTSLVSAEKDLESNIRTDESVTEAGSVCVGCFERTQNSTLTQADNQINLSPPEEESIKKFSEIESITCRTDTGSSFSLYAEGPFPCPQVDPHNCTQCNIKKEFFDRPLFMYMTCFNENRNDPMSTSGLAISSQKIHRIDKLGMSCISIRNRSHHSQNQNSRNSQSR